MGKSILPNGMIIFENSLCFACADNNHIIWAALTKNEDGIAVWKDQTVLFMPEGTADWGQPDLKWRESDGALLVSSCEQGGQTVWVWPVPGVTKATG